MQKWLVALLLFLLFSIKSVAQTDSIFWFAAPEVIHDDFSQHTDNPIFLRITTLDKPANVTIQQPANSSFVTINIFVAANASYSVDLTSQINLIESKPADQPINTGLLITSTALITAYYEENSQSNPEMFVLKGNNALGTNFFIPAQNIMDNWGSAPLPTIVPYASFDIVATEDNTVVTITTSNNIVGHFSGNTFTVNLNKGQVYSAAATSRFGSNHLMGSTVTSNKKIAITIKDDSIGGAGYNGCLDLAGDQIVPVELVGTKYITLPGFLKDPGVKPTDHTFYIATEDNTNLNINGLSVITINKGQTYHDSSMNEVKYIVCSKPTYVLHLSGFGCEVGHAMLPQIECTGSQKVAFTRSDTSSLYINILVPAGNEGNFKFNGSSSIITANLFDTVPFSGGLWKYARIFIPNSQLSVGTAAFVENKSIEFHLSVIHGDLSGGARYGYFSDFNKLKVTASSNAVNGTICAKSDLKFFTNYNNALGVKFNWTGPNGFKDTVANPILPNITTSGTGLYTLEATKFSCSKVDVPINIVVNPTPVPTLNSNAPVCSGNELRIFATYSGGSFNWTGPNGFSSTQSQNYIANASVQASGDYIVTTTANGCNSLDTFKNIVVNQTPFAGIVASTNNTCFKKSIILSNNNTVANTTYNWVLHNTTVSTLRNININSIGNNDTGKYILTASTNFCTAKDSFILVAYPIPTPVLTTNAPICSGNDVNISATYTGASFNWTGPNGFTSNNTSIIFANASTILSGNYKVVTTANNCTSIDSINVVVNAMPTAKINTSNTSACMQQSILLRSLLSANSPSFNWTLPNGSSYSATRDINIASANYNDSGKYILTANIGNCIAKDSVAIVVNPNPQVQFGALNDVCSNVAPFQFLANETTGIAGSGVYSGLGVSSNGIFSPAIIVDGLATIRYTYIANNGCSAFKDQPILVNPTPSILLDDVKYIKPGGSVNLDAQITGSYNTLIWQDASNTLSNKSIANPTAKPTQETAYKIVVTTNKNCAAEDVVVVKIALAVSIPNAFSPNGDNINDKWIVEDQTAIAFIKAHIFDRYGKLVKTLFGNKIEWDGMYNGQPLPVATYYYVLTITSENSSENIGGWIQLLR